jgi:hypothetical protein
MSPVILNTDLPGVKVNADVEYPALPLTVGAEFYVGFIPALKHGAFSLHFRNRPRHERSVSEIFKELLDWGKVQTDTALDIVHEADDFRLNVRNTEDRNCVDEKEQGI